MKENYTELVFILDKSGSMIGLTDDTIGGYNQFIEKQQQLDGEVKLTTVLFDHEYQLLHDGINVKEIKPLTREDYCARGSTALLDAIGRAIDDEGKKLASMQECDRPSKVLFAIITDGYENASRKYDITTVRQMITHQTEKYSWEFLFLGANIDAIETARTIGIRENRASNFAGDGASMRMSMYAVSDACECYHAGCFIDDDWKKNLEADYKKKKGKKASDNAIDNQSTIQVAKNLSLTKSEGDKIDELFWGAVKYVIETDSASIAMLQRRFSIGYNRAGTLIQKMADNGYVSCFGGAGPRKVLITMEEFKKLYNS